MEKELTIEEMAKAIGYSEAKQISISVSEATRDALIKIRYQGKVERGGDPGNSLAVTEMAHKFNKG